ncbi:MAG TPA: polysaccharide biosynthesis tyrosine autokinase [Vicinamibacterales bacterium]|nr:polysaccharide biosynthesis tyrosine autokinase [Vicinamibacterales bacterium]
MSRLSDALRRAGHIENEEVAEHEGDAAAVGDYAAENPAERSVVPVAMTTELVVDASSYREASADSSEGRREFEGPEADQPRRVGTPPPSRHRVKRPSTAPSEDIRIADLLSAIYLRKWVVAAVVVACVVAADIYNHLAIPVYQANTRLLLEPNTPEVVPVRPGSPDQSRLDYYVTQLEVLRSPSLARKTLDRLGMLSKNEAVQPGQVSQLLGALSVAPIKSDMGESRVINIVFKSTKPELAAAIPNGIAQTYVDSLLEERRKASRDAAAWLNQRVNELRQEAKASEGAVQQYREQKEDGVSLGDQNIVAQKLAQLNALVTSARTDRAEKEALYQQLKAIQDTGGSLDNFTAIIASPFIQGLKADLAGLRRERQQLQERLGELHPDMIKVNMSIAGSERRLQEEMNKIVEGVQNDYRASLAKEKALAAALNEQKHEVLDLGQKAIGFSALQRDNANTEHLLQEVLQRAKEAELSVETQSTNASILDRAEVPHFPTWPRTSLNVLIAALGGAFLGVCLALGVETVNPRLTDPADISQELGLTLLGVTPRFPMGKRQYSLLDTVPASFQEALRVVRTRILLSPVHSAAARLAVTSTVQGEGKTMIAANLAASIAMAGRRVLLVDADLRGPRLHDVFDVPRAPGLSDVLAGHGGAAAVVRETRFSGLFVMTAGAEMANPADLLDKERLNFLMRSIGQTFDVIILDCPPIMAAAEASIIANIASSVVFVVGYGMVSRSAARVAIERIVSVQGRLVGAVLNNAKLSARSEYTQRHYYGSEQRFRLFKGLKGEAEA